MLLAVFLRRLGAVVALLGISCALVALVLPWTYEEPSRLYHYSLWFFLITSFPMGFSYTLMLLILYLLPLLGACLVAVEGLRAWQGRAATRSSSARLLLGMGCALCGLITSHLLVGIAPPPEAAPPSQGSAGPGVGLALLGFSAVVVGGVLLALYSGGQSRLLLAVALRHVGSVVALLGICCLLVALVVPLVHLEPYPEDLSVLDLLRRADIPGSPAPRATRIYFLFPFLGSCCVVIEALWAWLDSAPTRSRLALLLSRLALLLLGMSCALLGLAAIPLLIPLTAQWEAAAPRLASAGPGASLASLGFGAVVAGGVLLAVGALLHWWTLRHNASRASATTTG